ncbi:MAG: methionine--tRNA ligase [Bacteriovoracaceae bacterium]
MSEKKELITAALPYANGPIHFGHLAGAYLPADIYHRHQKLMGKETLFICGSDEHGVAIMLNAKKAGMDYKEYVDKWHKEHSDLFKACGVEFDFFGQTSADYHAEEVVPWFNILNEKGLIESKENQQLFCNSCKNHLPDRFVEGKCYVCGYDKARGDECPNCGTFIEPTKLTETVCQICGSQEISEVSVTQYFLMLSKFHKEFRSWFEGKSDWKKTVYPFVKKLSDESLHDRAITRDLDWGIDVPLEGCDGKKLYVWFDAPIGYVSNTKEYLKRSGSSEDYLKDWWKNDQVNITNFIGKDNIIFHAIIFPVMSMASDRVNPVTNVPANQFLNLEGKQFSKSTGWYIEGKEAIEEFGQDAIRYYLISILPEMSDSSFSWSQFQAKINGELANNIGNFMNRCLKFIQKNWPDGLEGKFFKGFSESENGKNLSKDIQELNQYMNQFEFRKGLEKLMFIGQSANNFFSDRAPWAEVKEDKEKAAQTLAYSAIYAFTLGCLFKPFLPGLSSKILNHFSSFVDEKTIQEVYCGEIQNFCQSLIDNGLQFTEKVEALVPKIENEKIQARLEQLEAIQ